LAQVYEDGSVVARLHHGTPMTYAHYDFVRFYALTQWRLFYYVTVNIASSRKTDH
jgi:hypothetical protein